MVEAEVEGDTFLTYDCNITSKRLIQNRIDAAQGELAEAMEELEMLRAAE
jgi:hypothetical protein